MPAYIRPLAICLFTHADKILVSEGFDPLKNEKFFRPIGGGIEFGEYAAETIVRETREELGARVINPRYLFTLENLFEFNGERGHEIVLVYDAEFQDQTLYARKYLDGQETIDGQETSESFQAFWKSLDELKNDSRPLYPDGLLERLSKL